MLRQAWLHKEELQMRLANAATDRSNDFFFSGYADWSEPCKTDDWSRISRVSYQDDRVIGLAYAYVSRESFSVTGFSWINFARDDRKYSFDFMKDMKEFMNELLNGYNFRKISFTVHPANPNYKKIVSVMKRLGGRHVGTYTDHVFISGHYYDTEGWELMKANFRYSNAPKFEGSIKGFVGDSAHD